MTPRLAASEPDNGFQLLLPAPQQKVPRRGVRAHHVRNVEDIRGFFDRIAGSYADRHGPAESLLAYRCAILKRALRAVPGGTLLEVGCGTGDHLLALAEGARRAIGVDFSPAMIRRASLRRPANTGSDDEANVEFLVDDATTLESLDDGTVDAAFCVGALEHVPDKAAVFASVRRVLRRGGRFVCLTVNGEYLWHRRVARLLRYGNRHLSSDRFLGRLECSELALQAGFSRVEVGYWSFVPAGDMPGSFAALFSLLDSIGRALGMGSLRGGLEIRAEA